VTKQAAIATASSRTTLRDFATGNLHEGSGLWQDDVPTLMEYDTLITPAYFAFVRAFLTDPRDPAQHHRRAAY
jgi:hypothetical protein